MKSMLEMDLCKVFVVNMIQQSNEKWNDIKKQNGYFQFIYWAQLIDSVLGVDKIFSVLFHKPKYR